ncbi:hypothetical protein KGQ19_24690 [Catenulispora sp. NL8]|uniref:4-hydroxy-3-methylbut-2-enyl diphosphate reductase n=1 Tax=Catenulispora pinistramenti TaxID=2705254 RepID=A0ABS5KVK1_9ACTN|nr:hypothetical protein [Catenulispora pinistramenti]MBS2550068.1 hypothetical protein [Catenulispora pinistramenti]
MNRSLLRSRLVGGATGAFPGEVVVATGFTWPGRGRVRCAAAPLLAESFSRRGVPVRSAPVSAGADLAVGSPVGHGPGAGLPPDGEVVVAVSYLHDELPATGFGVSVAAADSSGLDAAESVIDDWAAVLRTRRLLVADVDGSCPGSRRAEAVIHEAVRSAAGPVAVVGGPVAVRRAPGTPRVPDLRVVDELDQVAEGTTVVFPAHGVRLATAAHAAARGLTVADATCPLVARACANVREYAGRGDTVALIGGSDLAVTATLVDQAPDRVAMVQDRADAEALAADPRRLSFVVVPGFPVEKAAVLVAAVRERYPRLRGHRHEVLCYAASDRAETVGSVAAASDAMFVLGTPEEADCREVSAMASETGATVHVLSGVADLRPEHLASVATVGVAVTRSAPPELLTDFAEVLSGLGPLTVARRSTQTQAGYGEAADGGGRSLAASVSADPGW